MIGMTRPIAPDDEEERSWVRDMIPRVSCIVEDGNCKLGIHLLF